MPLMRPDEIQLCACGHHFAGACPDAYARELEPSDGTIAELQSIVVAQRHRGEPDVVVEDLRRLVDLIARADNAVDAIRLSMALAARAVRYREELTP